jgi:phospholipid/cholesterol/gamma-HCH transport system substrate-binding protein
VILSRFVRVQLIIFAIATVIGVAVMGFQYVRVQTFLGIGKIDVTVELANAGGLYRFANVTYRGVQIGKVTAVDVNGPKHVTATLSIDSNPKIPADLQAEVRSVSAVGEQYVDLRPRTDSPPYLHDGSVIAQSDTTVPQQVGPLLDQLSALVDTIPKDQFSLLLDEAFKGFNGAGDDLGKLLDSSSTLVNATNEAADPLRTLIDQSGPLLQTQSSTGQQIRQWSHSLAGFTQQLTTNDPQLRTVLRQGPGFAQELTRLLDQVKPTLPILLANMTSLGQVGVTYNPSLEQVLVLLPPLIQVTQALAPNNNAATDYLTPADFRLQSGDPPPCTVGFLPPSQWRPPYDTTDIEAPDNMYCKLPQDSPIAVRGARNLPCMGVPGKRAPTVQICYSDKQYEPLAQRQPSFGPYPRDPNLEGQGIPPDDPDVRTNLVPPRPGLPLPESAAGADLPLEGTPPPDGGNPIAPPPLSPNPTVSPESVLAPPDTPDPTAPATPNAYTPRQSGQGPAIGMTQYDPRTGEYSGPDGKRYQQRDLVTTATAKTWRDLVLG